MIEKIILPATGFLRLPIILKVFPVSKSSWWLGVKEGKYPKPVKLGARTTAWRAEDIQSLINKYSTNQNKEGND